MFGGIPIYFVTSVSGSHCLIQGGVNVLKGGVLVVAPYLKIVGLP